jgi:UDP-GlcNAc:undecaprenyl-phosphate/decaprenyl-phosphate GlcNAc-1-phosphate transferase
MAFVAAFLTFVVTVVFLFALRPLADAVGLVDVPGGRKKHGTPVPLIGGICMSIGLGFGTSLVPHPEFWNPTILGVYLLVVIGTIDDRFDLPPGVRLIAHTCAALLVVFASDIAVANLGAPLFFDLPLGAFTEAFTVLFIIALINAFNLTDGIDGLAGGLALLSLSAMAIVGVGSDVFPLIVLLLGAVAAFLIFNFPLGFNRPVRTFMGDAGSTALGLTIAAIGVSLSQGPAARISPVLGLWLIAVPVFDLYSTLLRRLIEGRSPFDPDHEHLHHVLTENGLSRRGTVVWMLSLAAVFAFVGIIADAAALPDGVMLIAWFAAGTLYYQMMRRPRMVVRLIDAGRAWVNRQEPVAARVIPEDAPVGFEKSGEL